MVMYTVDLGPSQLRQLDRLFQESPYKIARDGDARKAMANIRGKDTVFASYSQEHTAIYHGVIREFSPEVRQDIMQRFQQVPALEEIAKRIDPQASRYKRS